MAIESERSKRIGNDDFVFLNKVEYLDDLVRRIDAVKKGDRVLVATMTFHPDEEPIARLIDALCSAASRGVVTNLIVDARSMPIMHKVSVSRRSQAHLKPVLHALQRLQDHGGVYTVTNETMRRLLNPFAGRSHIKTAIINDVLYVGGCNLGVMTHIDMMVRWRDHASADWLYEHMQAIVRHKNTRAAFAGKDQDRAVDTQTRLLLDAGMPNQSIIFEHALALIDAAQDWLVMTCQYFPAGVTIEHLAAAYKRGVKVSLYYNHPAQLKSGLYYDYADPRPGVRTMMHHVLLMRARRRQPAALFEEQLHKDMPFLHAKLIATEQGAMIGSHNYVSAGVKFGTAELALLRHDSVFAERAAKHFLDQLRRLA